MNNSPNNSTNQRKRTDAEGPRPQRARPKANPSGERSQRTRPQGAPNGARPQMPRPQGAPNGERPQTAKPQGHPSGVRPQTAKPQGHPSRVRPQMPRPQGHPNGARTQNSREPLRRGPYENRPMPKSAYNSNTYKSRKKRGVNDYLSLTLILLSVLLCALIITFIIVKTAPNNKKDNVQNDSHGNSHESDMVSPETDQNDISKPSLPAWNEIPSDQKGFIPKTIAGTVTMGGTNLYSKNAIMVDLKSRNVIAQQNPDEKIYPASLTKLMTVIVAAEHIEDMYDTFTLTLAMVDPLYKAKASMAYFDVDTEIPLIDLFYGACLPSGADASIGLAYYVAGSEEKFVELMNKKAEEMGLSSTHFTNCTGLHNENHYSSCRDLATILSYLMDNDFLRTVLSRKVYKTIAKVGFPDSTLQCIWSARLHNYESSKATMFAAKTGYTESANQCLASVSKDAKGNEYVIITTGAANKEGVNIDAKRMPYADVKYLCDTYLK